VTSCDELDTSFDITSVTTWGTSVRRLGEGRHRTTYNGGKLCLGDPSRLLTYDFQTVEPRLGLR